MKFRNILLGIASISLIWLSIGVLRADVPARQSIGNDTSASSNADEAAHNWVGKQLVFLEILKSDGDQEYSDFRVIKPPKSKRNSQIETKAGNPVYKAFARKIVTVTQVLSQQALSGKPSNGLVFVLNEPMTNTTIAVATDQFGFLHHIAVASGLQTAKNKWLNKTIYAKDIHLYQYDSTKGLETTVDVSCGLPLTVTDVIWGMDDENPIWVVVKDNGGRRGYYQISEGYSPINALIQDETGNEEACFFGGDSKALWSASTLDNISNHIVTVGMSGEQVLLALGAYDKINKYTDADGSVEQWIYPHKYVYLHSGTVTDIQEIQ